MTRPLPALVLFASTHGHTARIAERIAQGLRDAGEQVRVIDAADSAGVIPEEHGLVVLGGSIHANHHQASLRAWLVRHGAALDLSRTALFSVSLNAADDGEEAAATVAGYLAELQGALVGPPALTAAFAGALQYRAYDIATRTLMRLIARSKHLPTDPHEDVDYTDWTAVDAFAQDAAALVARPTVTH